MSTITVDGKEYAFDTLSDDAKAKITSIQAVDQKIAQLNIDMAIMQTARNAYIQSLKTLLPKTTAKRPAKKKV